MYAYVVRNIIVIYNIAQIVPIIFPLTFQTLSTRDHSFPQPVELSQDADFTVLLQKEPCRGI